MKVEEIRLLRSNVREGTVKFANCTEVVQCIMSCNSSSTILIYCIHNNTTSRWKIRNSLHMQTFLISLLFKDTFLLYYELQQGGMSAVVLHLKLFLYTIKQSKRINVGNNFSIPDYRKSILTAYLDVCNEEVS